MRLKTIGALIICFALTVVSVPAEETPSSENEENKELILEEPVTLIYVDTLISSVCQNIMKQTGINIIPLGPGAQEKRISIIHQKAPLQDALDQICIQNDLFWFETGENTLGISGQQYYRENVLKESIEERIFKPEFIPVKHLANLLEPLKTPGLGKIIPDKDGKKIIVRDLPFVLAFMERVKEEFDIKATPKNRRPPEISSEVLEKSEKKPVRFPLPFKAYSRLVPESEKDMKPDFEQKITAIFNNGKLFQVINAISNQVNTTIIPAGNLEEIRIDVLAQNIPLSEALEAITSKNNLTWWKAKQGNPLIVIARPEWYRNNIRPYLAEVKVYMVQDTGAEKSAREIGPYLTPELGVMIPDSRTDKIMVIDLPSKLDEIEVFLQKSEEFNAESS